MQNQSLQIALFLSVTAMVSGLIFPPLSAYAAVYVTLAAMLCGLVLHWREVPKIAAMLPYILVLGGFSVYALTEPFRWHGPDNLLILAVFMPVLFAIGLLPLLRAEPRLASPLMLSSLSLVGSVGAFVVALNDVFVLGISRAGGGNNPIHFADLVVTLGFISLVGLFGTKSVWRLVFFAGPASAVAVALLSGTRGAVMTILLVSALLAVTFCIWRRSIKPILLVACASAIIVTGGMALKPDLITRAQDGVGQSLAATSVLLFTPESGQLPVGVDASTDIRITMIRSAWGAFLDAPLFGHGAGEIIAATRPYYPERHSGIGAHLHSDWADFLVAGGIVGIFAYFSLLIAPFAAISMSNDRHQRQLLTLGAVVLSGTYLGNGMTNAVFGLLPQSTLFGLLLAWLVSHAVLNAENGV